MREKCIVRGCSNIKDVNNIFLRVPADKELRQKWLTISNYEGKKNISSSTVLYCCSKHFDIETDVTNWLTYQLGGTKRLILKPGLVPHKNVPGNVIEDIPGPSTSSTVSNIASEPLLNPVYINKSTQMTVDTADKNIQTNVMFFSPSISESAEIPVSLSPTISSPIKKFKSDSTEYSQEITETSSIDSNMLIGKYEYLENSNYQNTLCNIHNNSNCFIGVPDGWLFMINDLGEISDIPVHYIYLILMKIKLNLPFRILGIFFNLSESCASRIFQTKINIISQYMAKCILWPTREVIENNLPVAFRTNYRYVQSIIDCFEIEIEKPPDPMEQTLSWSQCKGKNTIKYLISSTPYGLINYVSKGFSGKATDMTMVKDSDYLQKLPENCWVMADRGFKGVEIILLQHKCKLIKPPTVAKNAKMNTEEVKETQMIAAVRTHVERCIRRIQEFEFLMLNSTVHSSLIQYLDDAVIIAAALCNFSKTSY